MAEEAIYSSGGGESNKRKIDDLPSPAAGVAKGFSSGPVSAGPPGSYNSVPPPLSEFELAKQRAQEIAARLLNSADPSKRARVENGSSGGGYDSSDYGNPRPAVFGFSAPTQAASAGYPAPSKRIEIPNGRVGVIIGKGGETIKYLQLQSGAKIQVTRDMDADPNAVTRDVELMGTADQIAKAEQLINEVLSEAEAGASVGGSRRVSGPSSGAEQFVMKIPNNKVGLVIGKGGETIKNMQATTGARVQVIPLHLPPGDMSKERTVQIDGTSEQIEAAKQLVEDVISENRGRNSSMSGGYHQQGYQARPPPNWGQPGPPMQQPGYGYVQPGAYSGPPPQYNMNQSPYPGYPPQPNAGGYSSGWDQSAPHNQHSAQGGGYDYYNQQPPQSQTHGGPTGPTDGSGYGYGQVPPYGQGQGYGQDGYEYHSGTAHPGYGQPPNSGSGYDQHQQGYNSSYGGTSNNLSSDGNTYGTQSGEANQATTPGQSYNAGGQPYPSQAPTQPGYGMPPSSQGGYGTQPSGGYGGYGPPPPQGQKPPGAVQPPYGQSQQSPSAQGGYPLSNYPQSQVPPPPVQPAHVSADSSTQWPPSSGYHASQQGYPTPPYGAQPTAHPGYGQQNPSQYNSPYGGGYSQPPPAYSSDGTASGTGRGGFDATPPPPQPTQPPSSAPSASAGSNAKSSPPS